MPTSSKAHSPDNLKNEKPKLRRQQRSRQQKPISTYQEGNIFRTVENLEHYELVRGNEIYNGHAFIAWIEIIYIQIYEAANLREVEYVNRRGL